MTRYQRLQRIALWIAWACGLMALLTGTGCGLVPTGEPPWVAWVHPLLILWGAFFGVVALGRQREVEAERRAWARDTQLTTGEQKLASKAAESESIRSAGILLAAALLLAGWLSYQFRSEVRSLVVDLLPATAFIGFGLGLVGAQVRTIMKQRGGGTGDAEENAR
ncbi:MAG: hypothetical protein K8J08_16370 [Thermoanaerobaculia bacterium]|nr:hypothetical protein [Thermoanaerobaculia bacterium]